MPKSIDLWVKFDKTESWFEKLKEADQHLDTCRLNYRQALWGAVWQENTAVLVDLQNKVVDAETRLIELHDERCRNGR